jgi:rSAM/selenodomain-associated transferase 2
MSKTVSVIIPTLNEGGVIANLLRDLQPLRSLGWEVIVSDGGSVDSTLVQAARFADRVLSCGPGRARQMNAAAGLAKGDVLWFLHADSTVSSCVIDQLRRAVAAGDAWGRFDVRLSGDHPMFRLIERMINMRSRLTGIATGDQAIFIRRDWFTAIGGFPQLPLMEDIAISRSLRFQAWPRCLSARVVTSSRRWERHGILRTVWLMWRLRLQYFLRVPVERLAREYRSCSSPTAES